METPPASTYSSQAERASRRPTDAQLRDQAQGHLDARRQRLDAYEASLEEQLANAPTDERAADIEGQLVLLRRQIGASGRARLPRTSGADAADAPGAAQARALAPLRRTARARAAARTLADAAEAGGGAGTDPGSEE